MPRRKPSNLQRARLCVMMTAGALAATAFLSSVFLVPLELDPALAGLQARFSPAPANCQLVSAEQFHKLSQCSWFSCSHGCTAQLTSCTQLRVRVRENSTSWREVPLLVNALGCGYPPRVNCTRFFSKLLRSPLEGSQEKIDKVNDSYMQFDIGRVFPCYPNTSGRDLAVLEFSWSDNVMRLILATLVPLAVLIASLYVVYHCHKGWCLKYEKHNNTESAVENDKNESSR